MSDLPVAVWSGKLMGIGVHVLDDGRRIIDAADLAKIFDGSIALEDLQEFAAKLRDFVPPGSEVSK